MPRHRVEDNARGSVRETVTTEQLEAEWRAAAHAFDGMKLADPGRVAAEVRLDAARAAYFGRPNAPVAEPESKRGHVSR